MQSKAPTTSAPSARSGRRNGRAEVLTKVPAAHHGSLELHPRALAVNPAVHGWLGVLGAYSAKEASRSETLVCSSS
jgi:hypothetical protein